MANNFRVETYRSAKTLSMVVVALLAIQVVCYALYVVLSLVQISGADLVLDTDEGALPIPYLLIGLLSFVESLARLATIVLFLVWLHRVYSNLSPLKARNLEFTPGWAVGWWFIPFANLVKPYQVVGEAWRESDPEYNAAYGYGASVENPWFLPIWWGSFILGNIISRFAEKAVEGETILDAYPYLLILSATFSGVAAIMAIMIARDITKRQDQRNELVQRSMQIQEPPPPPTFDQN